MARYIIVTRSDDYCGCDSEEYYIFPEGTLDNKIDDYIVEGMYDYAEQYEYIAIGNWDEDWDSEEDRDEYYNNCSFDWHEATEEEIEEYKEEFIVVEI